MFKTAMTYDGFKKSAAANKTLKISCLLSINQKNLQDKKKIFKFEL